MKVYTMAKHDVIKEKTRKWKKEHPQRVKELDKKSRDGIRDKVFVMFGGKCVRCGFTDYRALQLDHIHRAKEKRNGHFRAGQGLYASILRGEQDTSEFQLLCANCNWIKRVENKEYASNPKIWGGV